MCKKEICFQMNTFEMRTHALKYKCTFGVQREKKGLAVVTKDLPVFELGRNNEAKNIPTYRQISRGVHPL